MMWIAQRLNDADREVTRVTAPDHDALALRRTAGNLEVVSVPGDRVLTQP